MSSNNKKDELKLLQEENKRLRKKLNNVGANANLLISMVKDAYRAPASLTIPKSLPKVKNEIEIALAHISDTQIGKLTETYDSEIAHHRIVEYARRVADCIIHRRKHAHISEIHLYLGGDMIEGELIFPHQAHLIDSSVFEQACKVAPSAFAKIIIYWLTLVEKIKVVCVSGNHGRPASKNSGSHPKTNWDRVCYEITKHMVEKAILENGSTADVRRVTWDIPDTFYAIDDILGTKNLVVHGHQIRGGFAGFPFYGVGKKFSGWYMDGVKEDFDAMYFGHFHQYYSGCINGKFWYCNGTTESDNDFAREEIASSSVPIQRLQFFNRRHGMIADMPIYLTYGI